MTNKLEKQFFDAFEIKPLTKNIPCSECEFIMEECGCFDCYRETYPPITDRILLELICIAHTSPVITFVSRDVERLKEEVLLVLCNYVGCRNIKEQVHTLFKEQ